MLFVLVLQHQYGNNGRDTKKVDSKSIPLDFELFQQFANKEFIVQLTEYIDKFVDILNQAKKTTKG